MKYLKWIGLYLIADGVISIYHFPNATELETFFRIVRAGIGLALYVLIKEESK